MLALMKWIFSPKVRARVIVPTVVAPQNLLILQEMARHRKVMGCMEYIPSRQVEFDLEAPKVAIEALMGDIVEAPFIPAGARALQVNWLPYEGRYHTFRVAL